MAIRTALLTNKIAPYRLPLLESLQERVGALRVFVSTRMEPDRPWTPNFGKLDVVVQKTLTFSMKHRLGAGVIQQLFIHLPFDTLPLLMRYKPEVVISGELGLRSLQAALYRRLRPKTRLLIWATLSEHTEKSWGKGRRMLRRLILRAADGVVVNGASGARYISSLGFARIFTMNQPVDVRLFTRKPPTRGPEAARRIVYSGRLIAQKGVQEFQHAAAKWAEAHPDRMVEILWIGYGELRSALERAALPGNMRQRFTGPVGYEALAALYEEGGTLVLPSLFDEWGLVVNEAMASGLPVLGSIYSQAVEEMVVDGSTGWRFDPLSPQTMTTALDAFFGASDEELAAMRVAARERATAITPERAAGQMRDAVDAVLAPQRGHDGLAALEIG